MLNRCIRRQESPKSRIIIPSPIIVQLGCFVQVLTSKIILRGLGRGTVFGLAAYLAEGFVFGYFLDGTG